MLGSCFYWFPEDFLHIALGHSEELRQIDIECRIGGNCYGKFESAFVCIALGS